MVLTVLQATLKPIPKLPLSLHIPPLTLANVRDSDIDLGLPVLFFLAILFVGAIALLMNYPSRVTLVIHTL